MKKSIALFNQGFESATRNTPEFNKFARTFKKEFTAELESAQCSNIVFSKGHFYMSGFFTSQTGQPYYFSLLDVRYEPTLRMYVRKVKDYKDYTGGVNNWVNIEQKESGFMKKYIR